MPAPKLYMDSCCFIDVAKEKFGVGGEHRENEVWYIRRLLRAALDKKIVILTSTFTLAECLALGEKQTNVPEDVQNLFKRVLASGEVVLLAEASYFVMERARNLRWKHKIFLKPADSVHVASSLETSCVEFLTTDGNMDTPENRDMLQRLSVHIVKPSETQYLPDDYMKDDLFEGTEDLLR